MNRCPRPEATRALSAQDGRPPNVRRESWALAGAGATVTRSAMGRRDVTGITAIGASNVTGLLGLRLERRNLSGRKVGGAYDRSTHCAWAPGAGQQVVAS